VDDQRAEGSAAGGLFVLVRPARVVGRRLAAELAGHGIGGGRLEVRVVDQEDGDLALQVDALEVVPAAFGRGDAVAHEDQRGVLDLDAGDRPLRAHHEVRRLGELAGLAAGGQAELRVGLHLEAHQLHGLGPAAVVAGRVQAERFELAGDVLDRARLAGAAGRAARELRIRQRLDVGGQAVWRDRIGGLGGGGGREQDGGGDGGAEETHGANLAIKPLVASPPPCDLWSGRNRGT
jgi:hypothetical protein